MSKKIEPIFVECPTCGQGPKQRCRSVAVVYKPGKLERFHSARITAARRLTEDSAAVAIGTATNPVSP